MLRLENAGYASHSSRSRRPDDREGVHGLSGLSCALALHYAFNPAIWISRGRSEGAHDALDADVYGVTHRLLGCPGYSPTETPWPRKFGGA